MKFEGCAVHEARTKGSCIIHACRRQLTSCFTPKCYWKEKRMLTVGQYSLQMEEQVFVGTWRIKAHVFYY